MEVYLDDSDKGYFPSLKKVMVQKYGFGGLSGEPEVIWGRGD